MAALHVLKGANEGALIPLDGDKFVLGRNPDCGIVIPLTSVSREHAQILRVQGCFYIEDKQSRNGTYVNNQAITARTLVMSLWKVHDEQTRELMIDFYGRVLSGQGVADALRQAQLAMKEKHPDPYFWGAFICQGHPSPLALSGR